MNMLKSYGEHEQDSLKWLGEAQSQHFFRNRAGLKGKCIHAARSHTNGNAMASIVNMLHTNTETQGLGSKLMT